MLTGLGTKGNSVVHLTDQSDHAMNTAIIPLLSPSLLTFPTFNCSLRGQHYYPVRNYRRNLSGTWQWKYVFLGIPEKAPGDTWKAKNLKSKSENEELGGGQTLKLKS